MVRIDQTANKKIDRAVPRKLMIEKPSWIDHNGVLRPPANAPSRDVP